MLIIRTIRPLRNISGDVLKKRGYIVLPDPENPSVQKAFKVEEFKEFKEFERHSRLGRKDYVRINRVFIVIARRSK